MLSVGVQLFIFSIGIASIHSITSAKREKSDSSNSDNIEWAKRNASISNIHNLSYTQSHVMRYMSYLTLAYLICFSVLVQYDSLVVCVRMYLCWLHLNAIIEY